MKIGLFLTQSARASYQDLMEQVQYADEVGFDSIWLGERHFESNHEGWNFCSAPFIAASYIAAKTKRLRIGIGVNLLLEHPIHIAERAATVDVISNGRLDFGIFGTGANELYDQKVFGIGGEPSPDRFEQCLDLIVKAWTEERFSNSGLYNIPEVSVLPKPVQKPYPPIYFLGHSSRLLKFAAKRGLSLLLEGSQTVPALKKTQEDYYELLTQSGHERKDVTVLIKRFVYVGETNQKTVKETNGNDLLSNEAIILGDADHCLQKIQEMKETIDLRHLILTFNFPTLDHNICLRSMERFVNYVMPHLKSPQLIA